MEMKCNKALGLFEIGSLATVIKVMDVMLKSSNVEIIDKEKIGSGIVTVLITGNVADVIIAIESGKELISKLGLDYEPRTAVIPRPHDDIWEILP